jgi:uncharacterized surface protein with fasciclin (FAS1) repeats
VTVSKQTWQVAAVALVSVCLAAGCTDAGLLDNSSAAAAPSESVEATIAGSSVPTAAALSVVPSSSVPSSPSAPSASPTLDELLAEERFVALAVALERSGLDGVIEGLDDFVLLAPTGTAFASAGADVGIDYSTLMNNQRLLEAVIRYHVVADPSVNESWRTLNGAALDVSASDTGTIDGIEVIDRIAVRNGIVLVMPQLLLPESQPVGQQPPSGD